ncbi:MAG: peptide-methionine (S)-S-oxide reductase MsrA [Albidovulum sp.]|nr:peptide-methionine (S)-S-oxide reductase MsrA [Albidovulum sp.]MDE0307878.1 peptide-methionine (S)-S-oxide reductase MsrA [Albidovulum sp.]MDE0533571.1 peptide-methionine (S)-S-oxide reductase MsrA [Albidovulum sp.]
MALFARNKLKLPAPDAALPGRPDALPTALNHFVNGRPLAGPFPEGMELAMFGMGCFWGVEKYFWQFSGVWVTAVGYAGGFTPNPTYREVCTGMTGHNEVVRLAFDPKSVSYSSLLRAFWENHDPTQGMRQGNDFGTQYRSGIYAYGDEQLMQAQASLEEYSGALAEAGYGRVTTEIDSAPEFYFAEDYHQQYLAKNPFGYCDMRGTGVSCGSRASS